MSSTDSLEQLSCISIIVCDDVYRDERTKKLIIVGVFNSIAGRELPVRHPRMCVLFSITNGNGTYDLGLTIEHEATGTEIMRVNGPFEVKDPLGVYDIHVELRGLSFPHDGKYWVTLRSGEAILQQRPFSIKMQPRDSTDAGSQRTDLNPPA